MPITNLMIKKVNFIINTDFIEIVVILWFNSFIELYFIYH